MPAPKIMSNSAVSKGGATCLGEWAVGLGAERER
jgi:hypothetical protein